MTDSRRIMKNQVVVPEEAVLWLSSAVMLYAIIVPLLALDSLALAESLLRFSSVYQLCIVLLLFLSTFLLLQRLVKNAGQFVESRILIACFILLLSAQPSDACCSKVTLMLAGWTALHELTFSDVVLHLLPVIGSMLLVIDIVLTRKSPFHS